MQSYGIASFLKTILRRESSLFWMSIIYGVSISFLSLAVPLSVQFLINSVSFTASANSTGGVSLSLNSTQTTNLVAGRYVYDVEVTVGNTSPASISRVVEGIVTVTPNVTR